ncbi:hypothetical protein HPT25_20885 [Bacillus sp. BRMEA1]|uniref:replicative DNA helicase n=1 Tax=Neobacillus endophyticus TaxID=2738405 RepID=UPI00156504B2|nr:DnaB-like helicase C-terminal domain-containing protein [Neobacillus endophyticus]NRD79795.1 hypothetical protein [Neobacillus endophyticus]
MEEFQPFYQEAEEAIVGAFFLDGGLVKECTILPEQLYTRKLRTIFSAIRSLDSKGVPIDFLTVVQELGDQCLEWLGGVSYLNQLAGSVPTTANFHFYEKIVKEYDQKRKAIQVAGKIIEQAGTEEIGKTLRDGINELMAVEDNQTDEEDGHLTPAIADLYEDCEKEQSEIVGIASGFADLDQLTKGFNESDLIIVGARPSMGKTAFALNIALNASIQDVSVIFSLEMGKKQLLRRLTGSMAKIDSLKMKNPRREFHDE